LGRRIEESINGIRKDLSVLGQIKLEPKEKNMKRKRLSRKNNKETKENVGE